MKTNTEAIAVTTALEEVGVEAELPTLSPPALPPSSGTASATQRITCSCWMPWTQQWQQQPGSKRWGSQFSPSLLSL